jgi:hypothetical protein
MSRRPAAVCALALALAQGAAAAPRAERVTPENAGELLVGGIHAIGGIGDWALSNGTLCAVVSDAEHEGVLSERGGVLVDLGHCGRADDQFNLLQPVFNLSRGSVPPVDEVSADRGEREARIATRGRRRGVVFETVYALGSEDPERLRIRSRLRRVEPGERLFLFGDVMLHGNASLSPFTLSLRHPDRSEGFAHPPVDPDAPLTMLRALSAGDVQILVGADLVEPGIAYGLALESARLVERDGRERALPSVSLCGVDFSTFGVLSRPFWIGSADPPGWIQLAQGFFMDLGVGESLVVERTLTVGRRADASSITDRLWREAPLMRGRVDDAAARLLLFRKDGGALTQVRPGADGAFAVRVPPGEIRVEVRAPAGRSIERSVRVEPGADLDLGLLAIAAPARVRLPQGIPMRLVFRRADGRPTLFHDDLRGLRVGADRLPSSSAARDVSLAGAPGDPELVELAPGDYRVFATRGLEYTVTQASLRAVAGEVRSLEIRPPARSLETPGWVSADLHVHAGRSDDSSLRLRDRVASFAAQGTDILVATDHDRITDYGPLVHQLGLAGQIATIPGAELTSTVRSAAAPRTFGHANAFPLERRPLAYRDGTPRHEGMRLRRVLADLRALPRRPLVQLNHPRPGDRRENPDNMLFEHLSVPSRPFDPARPLDASPNSVLVEREEPGGLRDLDFDAIELMNGPSMLRYTRTRADWLSLLFQGEFRTATANSDSHDGVAIVAMPRTYVRLEGDGRGDLDARAFVRALRRGAAFGTTGPLVEIHLGEARPGELYSGQDGVLVLRVRAAPWVPVSRARVYVDGAPSHLFPVRAPETLKLPMHFAGDAFVTVEVEGEPDEAYAAVAPGFRPFAFTNPIFVDADGDGRWSARGLPDPLPASVADPEAGLEAIGP